MTKKLKKTQNIIKGMQLILEDCKNQEFLLEFQILLQKYKFYRPRNMRQYIITEIDGREIKAGKFKKFEINKYMFIKFRAEYLKDLKRVSSRKPFPEKKLIGNDNGN